MAIKLRRCLFILSMILGLQINLYKNFVTRVAEMDPEEVQVIADLLGCQIGSLSMKYLGLQLGGKRKDIQSWNCVLELIRSRLASR